METLRHCQTEDLLRTKGNNPKVNKRGAMHKNITQERDTAI